MLTECWWCLAPVPPYEESERRFCDVCAEYARTVWAQRGDTDA